MSAQRPQRGRFFTDGLIAVRDHYNNCMKKVMHLIVALTILGLALGSFSTAFYALTFGVCLFAPIPRIAIPIGIIAVAMCAASIFVGAKSIKYIRRFSI
jgi:hypothetical protein